MGFLNFLKMEVIETDETIIVKNINGQALAKFISSFWKTTTIDKHMFKSVSGGRFGRIEFYKFFTIDVIYILERLAEKRNGQVPSRTLYQMAELIKENTWFKDTQVKPAKGRLDYSKLKLFRFKPKDYQKAWLDYYNEIPTQYHLNGALLAAAPGAGKSFSGLMTMTMSGVDKIIVVCPKVAIERVWEAEVNLHYLTPPKYWSSKMMNEPDADTYIYIYHYEALDRAIQHMSKLAGKFSFGCILDESHNFNDVGSQRTQRWLELIKLVRTTNIIHASGTPLKAMGSEAIPLLRAIDPIFTKKVEERFKKIYGTSGNRGLDILRNRLGLISYKVEKAQLGLQPPIINVLPVKMPNGKDFTLTAVRAAMKEYLVERMKYYKLREKEDLAFYLNCLETHQSKLKNSKEQSEFNLYKSYVSRIQRITEYSSVSEEIKFCKKYEFYTISANLPQQEVKAFRSVCAVIKYLPLKIQGEVLGNVVGKMRIQAHLEMCKHIPFLDICESTKKKTVVFTSFVDVLQAATNACREVGLNPLLVYGKTTSNIANIVKSFGEDETVNPLIATYDSLSTAVPLVMADTMIMVNAPFRAYIQDQAISRIHRLRQDSQTKVYQCFLDTGKEPNISSRSLDIMKWSQQQVEEMTGVRSPYTIEDSENGKVTITTEGLDESLDIVLMDVAHFNRDTTIMTGRNW